MQKRTWTTALYLLGICLLVGCEKQYTGDSIVTTEHFSTELSENLTPAGNPSASAQGESWVKVREEEEIVQEAEESVFYEKDGKQYQKVRDLISGQYEWASAVTSGDMVKDDHGHERVDYYTQDRIFERLDGTEMIDVRRWDNLCYSAGDYLIFEYNGTMHVSKYYDLYRPVLSYDAAGTYAQVIKVPRGYMVGNVLSYTVILYDEDFNLVKTTEGYRVAENGLYFQNGLMAVRDMQSGLMGYMDQEGNLSIPCQYGLASDFSNGYASVLADAEMVHYTEDAGTISMFYGRGGNWGIIDVNGNYVLEPLEKYANKSIIGPEAETYYAFTMFTPVREDGTADFISMEMNDHVLETVLLFN